MALTLSEPIETSVDEYFLYVVPACNKVGLAKPATPTKAQSQNTPELLRLFDGMWNNTKSKRAVWCKSGSAYNSLLVL